MCDKGLCTPTASNAGKGNALGFSGTAGSKCCAQACPAYPIHTVNICVLLNLATEVRIQQGCITVAEDAISHDAGHAPEQTDIGYSSGQTYDSWGRSCRVVNWTRKVPDDAFIRLRFLPVDDAPCSSSEASVANKILKFEVDGVDLRQSIALYTGVTGGVSETSYFKAGCMGSAIAGSECCDYEGRSGVTGDAPNWAVDNVVVGAEVVIGPINAIPYSTVPNPVDTLADANLS